MKRVARSLTVVGLALAVCGCAASLPKTVPDYAATVTRVEGVGLMPCRFGLQEVGTNLVGMYEQQVLTELNHDLEQSLETAVKAVLEESRFKVTSLDVRDESLRADPELASHVSGHEKAIQVAFEEIASTKGKTIQVRYPGDVDYFADRVNTEFLLIVEGGGWFKTTGARVLEFLALSSESGSATSLMAMLVDASSGNVLWYNQVTLANHDPRKVSQMTQTAQKLLEPLTGKLSVPIDRSHDEDIIHKYKDLKRKAS